MSPDPWTADDPQPGDFDAQLARIDRRYVQVVEPNEDVTLADMLEVAHDSERRLLKAIGQRVREKREDPPERAPD